MSSKLRLVSALFLPLCLVACGKEPAELVLLGGDVHTADPGRPRVEAFAVRGGRFVAVGDTDSVRGLVGPATEVLELSGETVLPGLIDGHVHMGSGIPLVRGVNLYGIADEEQWLDQVAAKAADLPSGSWIVGGRWDHTLTPGAELPTKEDLDAVTPEHPVALSDVDGHSTWVNTLALEIAGVDASTPDPVGGEIVRDPATREPTGVLFETAGALVTSKIPPLSEEERLDAVRDTLRFANSLGLTGVHDMSDNLEAYARLAESSELTLRVWYGETGVQPGGVPELAATRDQIAARVASPRGPLLEVGYVKHAADGVLSTRTAALLAPYADAPDETGLPRYSQGELDELVAEANAAGFPVAIHAIGDRAVRMSLDAFEASPASPPLPNRIEHIEVLHPDDAARFGELGILASMNPHHCITGIDVYNTRRVGPERAAWAFAWAKLRDQGARLVFGSDWATAPLDPMRQLYAAVVREKPQGGPPGGWYPQNKVSFEEALFAYTQAPSDAAGWGDEVGSIQQGKWADFVVLDGPLTGEFEQTVVGTYLAGARVFP